MGTGGHNVPIVNTKFGFRKLTPTECFLLQGFDNNFKIPKLSDASLYTRAGNSVSVTVIARIAEKIIEALQNKIEIRS
jgi:DNA (cytosine-5)-methyltransferase 1